MAVCLPDGVNNTVAMGLSLLSKQFEIVIALKKAVRNLNIISDSLFYGFDKVF